MVGFEAARLVRREKRRAGEIGAPSKISVVL